MHGRKVTVFKNRNKTTYINSSGAYPIPDSMKSEYETNPLWAEATNDDKANQLPDEE